MVIDVVRRSKTRVGDTRAALSRSLFMDRQDITKTPDSLFTVRPPMSIFLKNVRTVTLNYLMRTDTCELFAIMTTKMRAADDMRTWTPLSRNLNRRDLNRTPLTVEGSPYANDREEQPHGHTEVLDDHEYLLSVCNHDNEHNIMSTHL